MSVSNDIESNVIYSDPKKLALAMKKKNGRYFKLLYYVITYIIIIMSCIILFYIIGRYYINFVTKESYNKF